MISRNDIKKYIQDIARLETEMEQIYTTLSQKVNDLEIKAILSQLAKEEKGHAAADENLINMLIKP